MGQTFVANRVISCMVIYRAGIGSVDAGRTDSALKACNSPNEMFKLRCEMALSVSLAVSHGQSLSVRAVLKRHQSVTQCAY